MRCTPKSTAEAQGAEGRTETTILQTTTSQGYQHQNASLPGVGINALLGESAKPHTLPPAWVSRRCTARAHKPQTPNPNPIPGVDARSWNPNTTT